MIFLKGERPATVIVSHIIATSSINSHTHDFHAIDKSSCRACCYIHQGKATRLKSNTLAIDIPILQRDRSGSNQNRSLYRMDENVHAITSLPSVLLVNSLKTADEIEARILCVSTKCKSQESASPFSSDVALSLSRSLSLPSVAQHDI